MKKVIHYLKIRVKRFDLLLKLYSMGMDASLRGNYKLAEHIFSRYEKVKKYI